MKVSGFLWVVIAFFSFSYHLPTFAETSIKLQTKERVHSKILPNRLTGFTVSPDGLRVAYIVGAGEYSAKHQRDEDEEGWESNKLVVDGKLDRPYWSLEKWSFSPNSQRIAYIARSTESFFAVVDGAEYEHYGYKGSTPDNQQIRDIYQLRFSPDSSSFVYVASSYAAEGPSFVVVNGKKEKPYASVHEPVFSPDSKKLAYQAEPVSEYGGFNVIDGVEGKKYFSAIHEGGIIFSPDSKRYAYCIDIQKNNDRPRRIIVVDDKEQGDCSSDIKFSPNSQHFAYVNQNILFFDGKASKAYPVNKLKGLQFSLDSKRLAFVADSDGEAYMVIDGKEGKKYNEVGEHFRQGIVFSPDSKSIAYMAAINSAKKDKSGYRIQEWRVVLNDKEDKPYRYVSNITFSPNSTKLAYVAHNAIDGNAKAKSFVIQNGVAGKAYDEIDDLVFSPDSKSLAYVARKNIKMFVVVNGKESKPYEYVIAKGTYERNFQKILETGSLRFDSNQKLRYLAVRNKQILLVETSFK